jgi:hypothetical protein
MLDIKIEGLEELVKKLDSNHLLAQPLRDAFSKSVLLLESEVKRRTPVDMGRLRSSITHEVDSRPVPLFGRVGTKVEYAQYVEFGTKAHWPPVSALEVWARRHGFSSAFIVTRTIAARGTRAAKMFQNAVADIASRLQPLFDEAARAIEERFGR